MQVAIYEPWAGEHIRESAATAKRMAKERGIPVRFIFNGVKLLATRKTSVDSLVWTLDIVGRQHAQTYRNSKRGRDAERRRKRRLKADQQVVNHLIKTLDPSRGLSDTVLWLAGFSEVADDVGLVYSKPVIHQALEAAGYVNNQHVGRPKEDFDDPQILGEWIVGQAINCLQHGMPPHPITQKFAKTYFNLLQGTL